MGKWWLLLIVVVVGLVVFLERPKPAELASPGAISAKP